MKLFIWLGIAVGSSVFGAIPLIWGDDFLSASSVLLSFVGALAGCIGGWKLARMVGAS